ncbi:MAG TPA: hypothetical protein VFY44_00410, partial [Thermoleophilaceae bacterium]|nr:hypothetical protein [Thermoleophilaceae bacterium]
MSGRHPRRLLAPPALVLLCLFAGPLPAASAADPVGSTTQAVAGVTAAVEQQVPAAGAVRQVTANVRSSEPVRQVTAQADAVTSGTAAAAAPATSAPATPAPAAPQPAPAPVAEQPSATRPAAAPRAHSAAHQPPRG